MEIKTQVKAGGLSTNHAEGLAVRTQVKAGGLSTNHAEGLGQ